MSSANTLKVGDIVIVRVKDKKNERGNIISINPNNVEVKLYSQEIVFVTPEQLVKKVPIKKTSTVGSAAEESESFDLTALSRQPTSFDSIASSGQHTPTDLASLRQHASFGSSAAKEPTSFGSKASLIQPASFSLASLRQPASLRQHASFGSSAAKESTSFGSIASLIQPATFSSESLIQPASFSSSAAEEPTPLAASFEEPTWTTVKKHRKPKSMYSTVGSAAFEEPTHLDLTALTRASLESEVERLLSSYKKAIKTEKPTTLTYNQVLRRSGEIKSQNFTLLRGDFRKCTQLTDFLHVSEADILAIKSQLDFVESTAFLLRSDHNLDSAMKLAFNVRTDFYREHFVAPRAKHEGNLQKTEIYLRLITMNNSLKEIKEEASILEKKMLAQVGLERSGGKSKNSYFVNGPKMTQENHNQMEILVKQFYRALLGRIIMRKFPIGTVMHHPHDQDTVTVTEDLIDSIPRTIQALRNARKLESEALLSCIGFEQSNKITEPHRRELEIVEMLADIDFETDPTQIIHHIEALIAKELQDQSKVKYLKYKIKYLNLKKQLNL